MFGNYLITAAILTMAIPIFGFLFSKVLEFLYRVLRSIIGEGLTYFLFNYVSFPGVYHHELSHALLATVTGAKVTKIVFFHPSGDHLGYVTYRVRGNIFFQAIQRTFTSIAPVFCGLLTSYGLFYLLTSQSHPFWCSGLLIYLIISILLHITMSSQDFRVMWKGMPLVYLLVLVLVWLFDN